MCRYAFKDYFTTYGCIPCRHVAQYPEHLTPRCPHCRADLTLLGRDFQAPRKRDAAGWIAVAATIAAGKNYDSCGCNGPGAHPRTAAEVRQAAAASRPLVRRNSRGKPRRPEYTSI